MQNKIPSIIKKRFIGILIIAVCFSIHCYSQIWVKSIYNFDSTLVIPKIVMPKTNNDSLLQHYKLLGKNAPNIFAESFKNNIKTNIEGRWIKNADNSQSWFCRIISSSAYNLNFVLENCNLPPNAKLYIINSKEKISNGPFTSKNINDDSTFYTEPLPGDDFVFELDVPAHTDISKSFFTIANICHDFTDFYSINKKRALGGSGDCEHDINCGIGLDWQKEKRAVVYLTFIISKGVYTGYTNRCTGTLINNTANNEIPYVLTANHCIHDSKEATSATIYFNYENSKCGTLDGKLTQSISGSKLIATTKDTSDILDFTLIQLKSTPPKSFNPYYAGWSLSKTKVNSVVGLHHPQGDALKISYSKGTTVDSSYIADPGEPFFLKNSHWQVALWDTGVTENVSSGSALFNSNHEIIGNLTGGESDCKKKPINDFYAKLYKSWDYFADSSNQLKYWLDPLHLDVTELNAYDPIIANRSTISNVDVSENLVSYNFADTVKGGWTGYNEPRLLWCAEKFTGIKNKYIYAIRFPIQMFKKTTDVSNITMNIWSGLEQPDSLLYTQKLKNDSIDSNKYYCLRLTTKLKTGSNFFIGFDLSKLQANDSVFLFTAKNRSNKSNTLYYYYQNNWLKASNLGLYSSLGIEADVTDTILPVFKPQRSPKLLKNIAFKTITPLFTKELLGIDSISNFNEKDWLQLHYLKNNKGIWSGTNDYGINVFAEKYNITNTTNYITGIKIAVAKNTITDENTTIRISLIRNIKHIDSTLYVNDYKAMDLKQGYYNVIKWKNFIKVDSSFYVTLSTVNINATDTFAIFMGNPKDNANKTHSFYNSNDNWINYNMYDIPENLCLGVESWYSNLVYDKDSFNYSYPIKNTIKSSNIVEKSFFIYPNPASSQNKIISLNFGYYKVKNMSIAIYDILGVLVSLQQPPLNSDNTVSISTENMTPGLYFVKVMIEKEQFKPIQLIIIK